MPLVVSRNQNSPHLLLGLLICVALVLSTHAFLPQTFTVQRQHTHISMGRLPDENASYPLDDGCEDEDECDIDWDAMPGWIEETEDGEVEAVVYDTNKQEAGPSVEQRRLHMEMQWQLDDAKDECVVEQPETCGSEKCTDCHGRGWNDCRFCHGTAVLRLDKTARDMAQEAAPQTMGEALSLGATTARKHFILPSSFSACKICQQGVEMCRTCQGSGWVAAWTQLPQQGSEQDDDPLLP